MRILRVGVIFGGMSSEKEVSLNSGRNVFDNLDREKYEGVPVFMDAAARLWILPWQLISQNTTVDITERLQQEARPVAYEELKKEIDFAFISLHGKYGDDGCIQGALELLGIPYTGPGVLASAIGMDKHVQQKVLRPRAWACHGASLSLRLDWRRDKTAIEKNIQEEFGFPLVAKPRREGSSIGVSIIKSPQDLEAGLEGAFQWDNSVLVEEFLEGIEFSSIVLERDGVPEPLGLTEIRPQSEFYTYDDKYMPGRCRKFTPPRNIPTDTVARIKKDVVRAFQALGFRGYGRIDGFVTNDGRILVTDPNSSSGMAPSSFFFEQAAESGLLPSMIISELIEISLKIHGDKKGPL